MAANDNKNNVGYFDRKLLNFSIAKSPLYRKRSALPLNPATPAMKAVCLPVNLIGAF